MERDDSGDPIVGAYQPWFMAERDGYFAVSESQFMFLQQIHKLVADGKIALPRAQLMESAFFLNYWEWVDRPEKQREKKKYSTLMKELLLIKR